MKKLDQTLDQLSKKGVWYIASAYSSGGRITTLPDAEKSSESDRRYTLIERVGAELYNLGFTIIEPIVSSHHKANLCRMPNKYEYWKNRDRKLIDVCRGVLVFEDKLDPTAWKESIGVQDEIAYAHSLGKEVYVIAGAFGVKYSTDLVFTLSLVQQLLGAVTINSTKDDTIYEESGSLSKEKSSRKKRQVHHMPLEALKYLNSPLEVGAEKGYYFNNWWDTHTPLMVWWRASISHLIDFDAGGRGYDGSYIEMMPDGVTPCKTLANHLDAALFNLMRIRLSIAHNRVDEDDRPMRITQHPSEEKKK